MRVKRIEKERSSPLSSNIAILFKILFVRLKNILPDVALKTRVLFSPLSLNRLKTSLLALHHVAEEPCNRTHVTQHQIILKSTVANRATMVHF